MSSGLTLGVIASSRKENERRLPLHPGQVEEIEPQLREEIVLEEGYGKRFGFPDGELRPLVGGIRAREELFASCDVLLLPKPLAPDLAEMREGQVLWGWPHCVQDPELTQAAIDRRLTLIAWEAMNHWTHDGTFGLHVFHKNNELAGYCSVLHAMQLVGLTGEYGRRLRAAVISFGSTGHGAVSALNGLGIHDITLLTHRPAAAVEAPPHGAEMVTFHSDPDHPGRVLEVDAEHETVAQLLAEHDIVVNCILQDTDAPLILVTEEELRAFERQILFVDVSCDAGMGFEWARSTSFAEPTFSVGDGHTYYAVDHSPSLLWDSATWEISDALRPFLSRVLEGPGRWEADETVRRAIEIREGVIQNEKILSFQERAAEYPHARTAP